MPSLLTVPILGRMRTRADKHKPHSYSFECGVLVAAERNASDGHCRRVSFAGMVSDVWVLHFVLYCCREMRGGEVSYCQVQVLILISWHLPRYNRMDHRLGCLTGHCLCNLLFFQCFSSNHSSNSKGFKKFFK